MKKLKDEAESDLKRIALRKKKIEDEEAEYEKKKKDRVTLEKKENKDRLDAEEKIRSDRKKKRE